jgi:DNA-3-methyladenine glycosylase II
MRPALKLQAPFTLEKHPDVCARLCASIMGQQLSTRVAQVLKDRFLALFNGRMPAPQDIAQIPVETLRGIGLSGAKAAYVHNVAAYFLEHRLTDRRLYRMSDDEVMATLLPIKGVGRWTVEMLLMFTLGREDIFSPDDLGIQQAMTALYGLDASSKKAMTTEMARIAEAWRPYRTFACLHLWRWKDNP